MNKRQAFASAKRIFPKLVPARPSMFATDDGKSVVIACNEQPVALVLYSETDLYRTMEFCRQALEARKSNK